MKTTSRTLLLFILVAAPVYAQSTLRLKGNDGDSRRYSGQVRLSGTYRVDYDGSDFDGDLSFTEDKASRKKLPSNSWREGLIFFNPQRNGRDLLRMFSIPTVRDKGTCGYRGKATIDIKDFEAFKAGSETGDRATLVRIVRLAKPKPVPCKVSPAKAAQMRKGSDEVRKLVRP